MSTLHRDLLITELTDLLVIEEDILLLDQDPESLILVLTDLPGGDPLHSTDLPTVHGSVARGLPCTI